jgi:hypothetical protein
MIQLQEDTCKNPTEKIYFCGLILYILQFLQYETQWEYGSTVSMGLKMLIMFLLVFHMLRTFPRYKSPAALFIFIVSLLITCIVGFNAGYKKGTNLLYSLLITFLLVFGAKNIEFRKIVKVYWLVGGVYCIVTVCSSLMGIIPNLVDVDTRSSEESIGVVEDLNRMSLGYGWSTNMANHVFFILLSFFYWLNRALKNIEMFFLLGITLLVLSYTGSRLSTLCVLLMLLFSLFYKTINGKKRLESRLASCFLIVSIPLFTLFSYYLTDSYDRTEIKWVIVDVALSGRLRLGNDAFEIAGIPLWGQFYEMFGSVRDDGKDYNYLDCSYIQSLVIYGLFYTSLIVFAYMSICRTAYKRKDFFLMYAVFFAGVSGLIAQHFIEMYMNPFLIALFAKHTRIDGDA